MNKEMYSATEAETKLLRFLKKLPAGKAALSEITAKSLNSLDEAKAKKALEGCLVKGFVTEERGRISLTPMGERQV